MSKESKLIKTTGIIAIGQLCTKGISFFLLPLYTAILTTTEYGTVDTVITISIIIVIVLTLQLEQGLFRYLIESRGDKERQKTYITSVGFVILGLIALFILSAFVADTFVQYEWMGYLVVMSVTNAMLSIVSGAARGLGENVTYSIGSFLSGGLNTVLNVVFIAGLYWNVLGMLLAGILANSVAVIFISIRCKFLHYIQPAFFSKKAISEVFYYSLPLLPRTLCWWVVTVSDRLIINIMMGVGYTGIYAVANKFSSLYMMVATIFVLSWNESACENVDAKERNQYYNAIMQKSIRMFLSITLLIILCIPIVFGFLVNEQYDVAYPLIPILIAGAFFHTMSDLYGSIFQAFKKTNTLFKITVYAAIINVVVNVALIKSIGLYAAAISALVAYTVSMTLQHFEIKAYVKICYSKKFYIAQFVLSIFVVGTYYYRNIFVSGIMAVILVIASIRMHKEFLLENIKLLKTYRGKLQNIKIKI